MHKNKEDRNAYMRKYRKLKPLTAKQKRSYQDRKKRLRIKKKNKLVKYFGGKCSICGYDKCVNALEFHHKNPKEKGDTLSRNITFKKMLKEAKKCILVCTNCHREIHAKEWGSS